MIVLDTSVVSFLFNGDSRGAMYLPHVQGQRLVVSFQTVEEMWCGAYRADWSERRRNELARHLNQYEVVWPDPEMAHVCAQLRARRERAGRHIGVADSWIAATAVRLGCPLASHDRDFSGIPNLQLISAA